MACIYIEDFCSFFMLIIFLAVFKDWFLYYIPKIYKIVLKMGVQFFTFIKMYSICQFKSEDAFYVYWQVNLDCLSDLTVLFWFVVVAQSLMSDSLWPHGLQHSRLPCPSPPPGTCSNSCPLNWWCHPNISSSIVPFSSCLLSFPASGSFLILINSTIKSV